MSGYFFREIDFTDKQRIDDPDGYSRFIAPDGLCFAVVLTILIRPLAECPWYD